ncbi:hypothetical protein D3C85_1347700 [compost metagenome]
MAASVSAAEPDSHWVVMLHAPTSVRAQKVRNPLHNASILSVCLASAGLPGTLNSVIGVASSTAFIQRLLRKYKRQK